MVMQKTYCKEAIMTVKSHHSTKQLLYLAKKEKNKRLAVRIQSLALAKQGFTCSEIVEMTGYPRRTIQRWVAQYNKAGIKGLIDKPRAGRPAKLSVHKQPAFCARIDAGPRPSDGKPTLYGRDIQQILKREFGVLYTLDGVYKLLHRLGYSCLKPRPRHEKADPVVQEAFKKTSHRDWSRSPETIPANV
jgi:transposase